MHEYWNAGYSPSLAPLDPTTTYYQLAEVGAIRPQQASHLAPEALVYFTEIRHGDCAAPDAKRILQPIPMHLATMLIPGTIWSANGKLVREGDNTYSERRTLIMGKRAPILRRLSQLFPLERKRPLILRDTSPDTWYAVINGENEKLLIPCFELLRAFCYNGASGLISYFFSRLPLDALCWPIATPNVNNGFAAHFCVACKSLTSQGARVLAALLFNTHYYHAIQEAHAHLAATWHACEAAHKVPQAYAKVNFKLGREVETKAKGISFSVEKQNYFWVSCLNPSYEQHGFKRVVYHPLGDKPEGTRIFSNVPQPAFRDMMHGRKLTPNTRPTAELPDSFKQFGRGRWYNAIPQERNVPVIKAFQWARRLPMRLTPVFAETQIFSHLWSRPSHIPVQLEGHLPNNICFNQVVARLRKLKCVVKLLEVNNPNHQFGLGHSIFPYVCPPYNMTHLPDGRYRPLSIACIQWGGGYFYLFNFLEDKKLVLLYKKTLGALSSKDCNDLLLEGIDVYFDWKKIARKFLYTKNHFVKFFELESDIAETLYFIHDSIKYAISDYNLMDNYNKQISKLNLSDISFHHEQVKVMNNLSKIYYMGDFIGEPFIKGKR